MPDTKIRGDTNFGNLNRYQEPRSLNQLNQKNEKFTMKKHIIALALLCSSIATLGMSKPASAQFSQNSIGPSVGFGAGQTVFGIDSKFGLSNNLSLRPFVYFPSGGTNFGTALTYDLNLNNNPDTLQLTPFVGASVDFNTTNGNSITSYGLVGGVDLDLTDSIRLKGAIIIPFNNDRGQSNTVTVGAGFRF
jgi:opacity protein-like surface antigen